MRHALIILLLLISSSVFAQTSIFSDPEKTGADGEGSVGFSRRHGSSIIKTQDSVLVIILNNDVGNDCRTLYSDDGGATWTLMSAATFGIDLFKKYTINVDASDTVYFGGATNSANQDIIRSWYDGTWHGFDTLGALAFAVPFMFRSSDTLGAFQKVSGSYEYTVNYTDQGFDDTTTWTGATDTTTLVADFQDKYISTPTKDGVAVYGIDWLAGEDTLYFASSEGFVLVQADLIGDYAHSETFDGLQATAWLAGMTDSDTIAIAVQDFDSLYVEIGRLYDNAGTMTWSSIRQTTVVTGRFPTYDATEEITWSYPVAQWDSNGALRVYCKDWADTSDHDAHGIVMYESTDYGTTFGSSVTLLSATTTDSMTQLQAPPVSSLINDGQILRSVAYCDDGVYGSGSMSLYFIADSTALLDMGGAETGKPYFPGVK